MRSSSLHRTLDRAAGGAIISAVSLVRRRRALPADARRVVVLQPTAIGDTLIGSGILSAIRRRFPGAEMTVLHGPSNGAALPLIDGAFEAREVGFTRPWKALSQLRELQPEVVVDLTPWPRATALCAMGSGAVAVGYDSTGQGRGRAFDIVAPHLSTRHEIDNARAMAAIFDPDGAYRPAIARSLPRPGLPLPYERLVLLHTVAGGSRRLEKSWANENWGELARRLNADGFVLGFTGTKGETAAVEAVRAATGLSEPEALMLTGRLTLAELAHVLQQSRCLVSLDTGAVHLASAVNAPVVGLYGATRSARWGPWGSGGVGVDSTHPDAGYCSLGFENHPRAGEIMNGITVDRVYDAVRTVLDQRAGETRQA